MKNLLRVLAVSLFLTTFGVVAGFAQDENKEMCPDLAACFAIFKTEIKKSCGDRAKAIEVGKYIGEKFKDDEENKALVDKIRASALKMEGEDKICKRNNAYNDAYKTKNWDAFYTVGKEIINDPSTEKSVALDVMLDLVSVGLNNAVAKNDKFNNETMMYAKSAITNIQAGVTSNNLGVFEPFKSKENALSWANYTIGWIMYDRQGKKEEAIPYFYKATQVGEKKNETFLYIRIGQWYGDKATALYDEYTKINDSIKTAATEEEKTKLNDDAKAKLALARGYAERAMDAFARAQKVASAEKPPKPDLIKNLNDEITKFYKFRFNGKAEGQTEYVSALIAKPMPDPTTAVMPVVEETTPTTTTTSTTEVKPTSTVKSASTTTETADKTTVSTTAKKPVTKKKANR